MYVDSVACTNGGLLANSTSCHNLGKIVVVQQAPVGGTTRTSRVVTPPASICSASNRYEISTHDYLTNPAAQVLNSPITFTTDGSAWIAEMIVASSDLSFGSASSSNIFFASTAGNYAISVF
jgi:hypothetical protein